MNFATGDNRGHLFAKGDAICRVYTSTDQAYPQRIYSLYCQHHLEHLGIVQTERQPDGSFLHPRLPITYPHEWCPGMFKEAVLFYLDLLLALDDVGLTLKDALPENILFHHGRPVFVDFFSLVTEEDLERETWLPPSPQGRRYSVLDTMFVPHMLLPLMRYAEGQFVEGRQLLSNAFCNNADGVSNPVSVLFDGAFKRRMELILRTLLNRNPSPNALITQRIISLLRGERTCWINDIRMLRKLVAALDVTVHTSGYTDYYKAKKENFALADQSSWQEKQRSYAQVLEQYQPTTLLELGGNTGWFPRLAAARGVTVVATDIDMACVEHMHWHMRFTGESITPLWLSFDDLSVEQYSLDAAGQRQEHPLHMAATKRLPCQMISCLGLMHHLTLGMGKSFAEIAEVLHRLCQKILLLEFVSLDDHLIYENPSFFPNISKWNTNTYSVNALLQAFEPLFHLQQSLPSSPVQSRSLLLFKPVDK